MMLEMYVVCDFILFKQSELENKKCSGSATFHR